ncbi:SET domain-containing protein [Daldinia vernicosa]|uniref:SET domain-containing protein n=1 Tax=Daldinia vernicosa TaxID=114800 RepID=UPI0020073287|nr:SET domain-containing protein [Daldinia vernicosa]KAI0850343.1 SET domain-containing protein [Daldinia vernicosa]
MRVIELYGYLALFGTVAGASSLGAICPWSPLSKIEDGTCAGLGQKRILRNLSGVNLDWEGPEHCVNETCIFSNEHIGDGIVLVTSEVNAKIASNFPVMVNNGATTLPFHVAEVPGKGVGIVADRKIRKGETILIRSPTMMVQTAPHVGMESGTRDVLYDIAVRKLPTRGRELLMGQMGEDVYDKIETNCFQMYIDGASDSGSHLGCYPEISRFNHDCRPNIHYRISNMTHITVAARNIEPGQELSISYIELMLSREERRSRLRKWGFECACSHCSMSNEEVATSDARLQRIEELETALENFNQTIVTADTGAQLADLYEKERLDVYLGRVYTRAALNFALFGEEEKAQKYALAAIEALEREFGPNAADAKAMRILAENPKAHWTWGKRRRGSSGKGKGK